MKFDIDGMWEGIYSYTSQNYLEMEIGRIEETKSFFRKIPIEEALKKLPIEKMPPDQVPFSLRVKKRWFNNISGTVQDDPSISNIKDAAKIYGKLINAEIYFTKVYPLQKKGSQGSRYECLPDGNIYYMGPIEPRIYYHGFIFGKNEIRGSWMIFPTVYHLKGIRIKVKEMTGSFYMFRSGTNADTEHPIYEVETLMENLISNLVTAMKNR